MTTMNEAVQQAIAHVRWQFPKVTQVMFSRDGRWYYCDDEFKCPDFDKAQTPIDVSVLEDAQNAADSEKGFPCAYVFDFARFLEDEYRSYCASVAEGDPMSPEDWLAGSDVPQIVSAHEALQW